MKRSNEIAFGEEKSVVNTKKVRVSNKKHARLLEDALQIQDKKRVAKQLVAVYVKKMDMSLRLKLNGLSAEEKKTFSLAYALLVLFNLQMQQNHTKAWHQKVKKRLDFLNIKIPNAKTLKMEVTANFPELIAKRGIFRVQDKYRVLSRHDDRRLSSEKLRYNHIKAEATPAERSWIKEQTSHAVINAIQQIYKNQARTTLDVHQTGLSIYKQNNTWHLQLETDQAQRFIICDSITSLSAGSHADFVVRDELGKAMIEAKAGFCCYSGNQYQITLNKVFTKNHDTVGFFSVFLCKKDGSIYPVMHILIKSVDTLKAKFGGSCKNYSLHMQLEFNKDGIATSCDIGKTAKTHFDKDCIIWRIQDKQEFKLGIPDSWYDPELDEAKFCSTSELTKKGDVGENLLQYLLELAGAVVDEGKGLITNDPADRHMILNQQTRTFSSKTIRNANGTNAQLNFPLTHTKDGRKDVPVTFGLACNLLGAVRHGDLHADWKAPEGAEYACLLFTKQHLKEIINVRADSKEYRGTKKFGDITQFCFKPGQFAENTWFFNADKQIIGDPRLEQLLSFFS